MLIEKSQASQAKPLAQKLKKGYVLGKTVPVRICP